MAVLLGLVAALAYGASDFLGGLVSRRTSPWAVALVVQLACTVSTGLVAPFVGGSPDAADLAWSALAGVGSGVGVSFLFRGFGAGRMTVVAPLSAVGSALVPVVLAIGTGERPGLLASVAMAAAFPGIWLVARESPGSEGGSSTGAGVVDGVLAGLGFGFMFTALGQVPDGAGLWPLTLAQAVSVATVPIFALALGAAWRPDRTSLASVPAGPLSAVAVIAFQAAAQRGLLSVSSVLTSLYPATTILLAVVVLHERVRRSQSVGLVLCGTTVALVALG